MRKKLLITFVILNIVFIWGNSILGQEQSHQISQYFKDFISRFINLGSIDTGFNLTEHIVRKAAHVFEYFVLGTLLVMLLRRVDLRLAVIVFICGAVVASADETIQIFTGRGPAVKDVLIDMCGFTAGMLFSALVKSIISRRRTGSIL